MHSLGIGLLPEQEYTVRTDIQNGEIYNIRMDVGTVVLDGINIFFNRIPSLWQHPTSPSQASTYPFCLLRHSFFLHR